MKIIITGGHLSPALAMIKKLTQGDWDILFVGRKHTLEGDKAVSAEYKIIKEMGIEFRNVTTGRLQRRFTRHTIFSLLKIPLGFISAMKIVGEFRPNVILSFGGYLGLPFVFAGWLNKIPTVIHEQTLNPGLANRLASIFATVITVSFEKTINEFPPKKTFVTGLPLREEMYQLNPSSKFFYLPKVNRPIIFVTGGNQGSHFINSQIEEILDELLKDFVIIHQTGESKEYKDHERLKKRENDYYFVENYIGEEDIGTVFGVSSFVIGRAGVNTVCELMEMRKPAILIPIPWSSGNEQLKNAEMLKNLGLARVLTQEALTPRTLQKEIQDFWQNIKDYKSESVNKEEKRNSAVNRLYQKLNDAVRA